MSGAHIGIVFALAAAVACAVASPVTAASCSRSAYTTAQDLPPIEVVSV
jgi:hypothetical protein